MSPEIIDPSAPSAITPLTVGEALQKASEIEIVVAKLSEEIGTGSHRSAFSGTGSEFLELKEYTFGDDIRAIDWNSTARLCETYLRVFTEDHDTPVYVLIDRSASGTFGRVISKDEKIFEIAVSLIFSASVRGDPVGMCIFTDKVELFVPPGRGRRHVSLLVSRLINFRPKSQGTDLGNVLPALLPAIKKRSLVVILSDFDSPPFEREIGLLSARHEIRPVWIRDRSEYELADVGYFVLRDPETGEEMIVNTSDRDLREKFAEVNAVRDEEIKGAFGNYGIRSLEIYTDDDDLSSLKIYFRLCGMVAE